MMNVNADIYDKTNGKKHSKKRIMKGMLLVFAAFVVVLFVIAGIYVSDYSRADEAAVEEAVGSTATVITAYDDALLFDPGNTETLLIFYPGGKVEYTAYEPLMIKLSEQGIACLLLKMPFNLAVFDINAADNYQDVIDRFRNVYIGGHSLGGSMAAVYADSHREALDGLVLLASYSTSDLSLSGLKVISIYGSNDGVLNRESYAENTGNLPAGYKEIVLSGGNHAGFGCYGEQKGDKEAEITQEDQQEQTAAQISSFMLEK